MRTLTMTLEDAVADLKRLWNIEDVNILLPERVALAQACADKNFREEVVLMILSLCDDKQGILTPIEFPFDKPVEEWLEKYLKCPFVCGGTEVESSAPPLPQPLSPIVPMAERGESGDGHRPPLQPESAPVQTPVAKPKSVPTMILEVAQKLDAEHKSPAPLVFDHSHLKARAKEMFPEHYEIIKRGIYLAINKFKKNQTFLTVPGGWTLNPDASRRGAEGAEREEP